MISEKWHPHGYMKRAVTWGIEHACAGFFLSPGLGKTSIILAIFKILKKRGYINRMLVIAPLRPAQSVWPGEVERWQDFNELKIVVLHGPKKADKLAQAKKDSDIMVINPEGLQWFCRNRMADLGLDMLVVDESTRFKHTRTLRFTLIKHLLHQFKRRYILTGSPAPNGLIDLFGQVFILDMGNALGKYISHYRTAFFDNPDGQGWNWVPRDGSEEAIYRKLKPLVLRMSEEDYLDLPPLVYNPVYVTLPDKARKQYEDMEEQLIALVEQDTITAANAAAASTKCRQIANGGIYHEGAEKWTNLHDAKTDAVEEIIEELQGQPALVAYEYRHDLDRLRKRLGVDVPYIGGGVGAAAFRSIEARWNAGEIPILLAQPQSVAHGLNLQGTAANVIFHSQTFDLEVREQFIRRVWRQGQKHKVIVHDIIAKKTVDELILKVLKQKDQTQRALLDALKTYLRRVA